MTQPHQCRCAICGEVGTILPGLPNVFAETPRAYGGTDRRKTSIVPTDTIYPEPRDNKPYADVPTCTHGYTRCMPCKFPPEPMDVVTPVG